MFCYNNEYLKELRTRLFKKDQNSFLEFTIRNELVQKYSWAIPNKKAIRKIAEYGPLIEIGAGRGYWASLISQISPIKAFDYKKPPHHFAKDSNHLFFPVDIGGPEKILDHSDHTLMLCWPPYQNSLAADSLKNYSGKYFVYIGESVGGCCANDEFFELLQQKWRITDQISISRYTGIYDFCIIFQRK